MQKEGLKLRIVGLGDSTTAGTPGFRSPVESPPAGSGNQESQYAYWMMKAHPDWEVLNRGINGERSDQILTRFARDVAPFKPEYVVIMAGVNDIYQGFDPEFTEGNLSTMYNLTADSGAMGVACTVLPYNMMDSQEANVMREINEWILEESKRRFILFSDTSSAVATTGRFDRLSGSPDGLHPDVSGYKKVGEAIAQSIQDSLGS